MSKLIGKKVVAVQHLAFENLGSFESVLRDHGMVDMVVHRHELRSTIADLCRLLTKSPARHAVETVPADAALSVAPAPAPTAAPPATA